MGGRVRVREERAVTTAIYLRHSTSRQDNESQLVRINEWIKTHGVGRPEWYSDPAESSAKTSRPQFDKMMERVRSKKIKRIVVYKLDRIGRWDKGDWFRWRLELDKLGVELVSILDPLAAKIENTADYIYSLLRAEGDREWFVNHSKRIRDGLAARRARGERLGALPKLSDERWNELMERRSRGESVASLAKAFGFNRTYLARKLRELEQGSHARQTDGSSAPRGAGEGD